MWYDLDEESRDNVITWYYESEQHNMTMADYIGDYFAPLNELIRQQEEAGKVIDHEKFTA